MSYLTVSGNIGSDIDLKYTPAGKAYARFSIAENRKWKDASGNDQEATTWHRCVAWGTLGENIAETAAKGMKVIAYGRLDQNDWTNDAGEKRSSLELSVSDFGPSLMWATAEVTKAEKKPGGSSNSAPAPRDYGDEPF